MLAIAMCIFLKNSKLNVRHYTQIEFVKRTYRHSKGNTVMKIQNNNMVMTVQFFCRPCKKLRWDLWAQWEKWEIIQQCKKSPWQDQKI